MKLKLNTIFFWGGGRGVYIEQGGNNSCYPTLRHQRLSFVVYPSQGPIPCGKYRPKTQNVIFNFFLHIFPSNRMCRVLLSRAKSWTSVNLNRWSSKLNNLIILLWTHLMNIVAFHQMLKSHWNPTIFCTITRSLRMKINFNRLWQINFFFWLLVSPRPIVFV